MSRDGLAVSNKDGTRAYVLIDTQSGMAPEVVRKLKEKGIHQADVINGPHGVIALVEGNNPSDVAVTILNGIRKLDGVTGLTVYLVTEQEQKAGKN
jgi:hypothetical protein